MTNREALKGLSNYPVPKSTIEAIAARNGLELDEEADWSDSYTKCEIAVLEFLSIAPDVTQDGISYSLTDQNKKDMAKRAKRLRNQLGIDDPDDYEAEQFGYQGELL